MRVLIDILHPAHVHFFRHFRDEIMNAGHEVMIAARDKDVAIDLLESLGIEFDLLSKQGLGAVGLGLEFVKRTMALRRIALDWQADILTGVMGPSAALVGRLLRIPSIVFYDTEYASLTNRWVYPIATKVAIPDCYEGPKRENFVQYSGYQELAYLHPSRFQPDAEKLRLFDLDPSEPLALLRFVSWQASHDFGETSLTPDERVALTMELSDIVQVRVSAEGDLPASLEALRLVGPPHEVHHVQAAASVLVGESATMCAEAAVLGTPAIYIANTSRGYLNDLATRYGLVSVYRPEELPRAIMEARDCLSRARDTVEPRERLLRDKIDVTKWMVDLFADLSS